MRTHISAVIYRSNAKDFRTDKHKCKLKQHIYETVLYISMHAMLMQTNTKTVFTAPSAPIFRLITNSVRREYEDASHNYRIKLHTCLRGGLEGLLSQCELVSSHRG